MGDVSAEPSMEDILSSIKRIIAEEGDDRPIRQRRTNITRPVVSSAPDEDEAEPEEVLELSHPISPAASRPVAPAEPEAPRVDAETAATVLSEQTAQATRGAIDALSRLLVKPEPQSDGTLEGLVREMLRPMLREWLDANLPSMVETIVAREIAKLTRSAS